MPTAKARYKGDGAGKRIDDFSDSLRRKIKKHYPGEKAETDSFVAHILSEAWWAKAELHWRDFDCTKAEIRAEHADLLKQLTGLQGNLQKLSPDLDRLLGTDADPLGCADKLGELIGHVVRAGQQFDKLPKAKKLEEKQKVVAIELAVRVLRALKGYGIAPAATGDAYYGYTSDAVQILKAIGDDISLCRATTTWRDIIIEAKTIAPDLK